MTDDGQQLCWTEEQWNQVRKTVGDEAQKARVAAQFLPLYGPVDPSVLAVPDLSLTYPEVSSANTKRRIKVDGAPNTTLATISVQVSLGTHEVAEPELLSALSAFRRAANIVGRIEDALVFNGQPKEGEPPAGSWLGKIPLVYQVTNGRKQRGLVPADATANKGGTYPPRIPGQILQPAAGVAGWDLTIVSGIVDLIGQMEGEGQSGPFACFLAPDVFQAVHTPSPNLVMARDRILPFLGGDYLRRTSTIPGGYGIVVALGGSPVEIVVGSDISVRFLQITPEPRYLFRVSERVALRVKEWNAVGVLHP